MDKTKNTSAQALRILQNNIREIRVSAYNDRRKISFNSRKVRYLDDNLQNHLSHFKKSQEKENTRIWIVLVLTALSALGNSYLTYLLYTK